MSYLVFARKWRPQSFEEVLAQDHVTVTLRNAIDSGRVGHAYLFTGPRGVGKTTTARILAKALNCEKGPTSRPCQECESCRRIASGSDMDVLEIDGASNRGIDEVRDLREKARYSPAAGRSKIYIIDEVHMLTREAFNALLKILEEPPDFVVFVFATTEPRKVPATIISRCQRFDFRRIPSPVMSEYLIREAAREGITIDKDAVAMVCRASGGSLRDALSIMDQLVSFAGGDITRESAESLLRVVESDLLACLASAILSGRAPEALDAVGEALDRGYSIEELCDAFIEYLRNLMLLSAGSGSGLDDLPDREMETMRSIAGSVSDTVILNVLRIVSAAASEAKTASLPRVALESAVMAATRMSSAIGLAQLPPVELERKGPPAAPSIRARPERREPAPRDARSAPSAGEEPPDRRKPSGEEQAVEAAVHTAPASSESSTSSGDRPPRTRRPGRAVRAKPDGEDGAGGIEGAEPEGGGGCGDADSRARQGPSEEEREATRKLLDLFDAMSYDDSNDRRRQ
ncbi:DNA polymerase III subunit gamma/tau [Candidatus Fermentibacteria bacterium]|nr:DNA polymerase III subunit gamma/tau [Candidatus Fermentibacteria bacterium]